MEKTFRKPPEKDLENIKGEMQDALNHCTSSSSGCLTTAFERIYAPERSASSLFRTHWDAARHENRLKNMDWYYAYSDVRPFK